MFRKNLGRFSNTSFFDNIFMLAVVLNTVILCLDGLITDDQQMTLKTITTVLTFIFVAEMTIKIIAFGPRSK